LHAEGVIARRIKRLWKAELTTVLPDDIDAAHLYISILDRETEARIAREAQLTGFQLHVLKELVERDCPIVLNDDFMSLEMKGELNKASDIDSEDSEDSKDFIYI